MPDLPEEFLRGVELFNDGRFFECHEVWEIVWLKADGFDREFLHAIIQAAAALHHVQRGNLKGALSVGRRAIDNLAKLPHPPMMMRLDTGELKKSLEKFLTEPDAPIPHIALRDELQ